MDIPPNDSAEINKQKMKTANYIAENSTQILLLVFKRYVHSYFINDILIECEIILNHML